MEEDPWQGGWSKPLGQLSEFPGEAWGDQVLEQDVGRIVSEARNELEDTKDEVIKQQIGGFGNTTQSLYVLTKEAVLTDQDLQEAAMSLLVYEGHVHFESGDAHMHPEAGTNLFVMPGNTFELSAVEPSVLVVTFMRF